MTSTDPRLGDHDETATVLPFPTTPPNVPESAPTTGQPGTQVEPTTVVEGELVDEEEYQRIRLERTLTRDLVVIAAATRDHSGRTWRFVRRHWAILCKGMDAERQRRKAERHQTDLKAARAMARETGDLERVEALNRQIVESRRSRVDALMAWVELVWTVTRKVTIVVIILTGVALVLGIANGIGGWFGQWDATDVLHTLGTIMNWLAAIVAWIVEYAWLIGSGVVATWLRRRWKDGKRLGEYVLPAHLRRDGGRQAQAELTENLLVKALGTIGNSYLNAAIKDGWPNRETDHAWVRPPMPAAKGWGAQLRLPMGASVEAIQKSKTTLAHNLSCIPAELFLEPSEDDPTVLDLFRLDRGVLREPCPDYPLLEEGTTDYWTGFPVGVSPRGAEVTGVTNERNYVISGAMGSGKSTLIVALLNGAALDPLVDIDVFVFAENADYDALKPCLNTFVMGDTEENVQACLDHIAGLHAELAERGRLLQKHGIPSVTREAAAKEPGLRPRIVVIDECQSFFRQDTPEMRRQVVNMMVRFFSASRKYGITCVFATPVPSDQSLPRDLVAVTSNRACYAIADKTRNNIVLGDKAHENGISALGLKPKTKDKLNDVGTFIGINFMDNPGTVRTYYISRSQQEAIVARALEARGGKVAEQAAPVERDALADILTVANQIAPREGEQYPRAAAIAEGLAARWTRYGKWRIAHVVDLLAEHGYKVPTTDRIYPVDPGKVAETLARRDAEQDE